jgi:putative FmdB family regulatory protein
MAIYEYLCSWCGQKFEHTQSIKSEPLLKCVYCQGPATRVIHVPALDFRGTGWSTPGR